MEKGQGILFVISAPSGAGKTTLLGKVMEQVAGLSFSVSHTTREPRSSERDGKDYHFVSLEAFQKMIEGGEFIEWAEVLGNRYGTVLRNLQNLDSGGIDILLDIDTQGARKIKEKIGSAVFIFLLPPSPETLRERLLRRGLDSSETIERRLANAWREMKEAVWYDYVIVNEEVESAVEQLKAIILAERSRKRRTSILQEKLKQWEGSHGENHS
jgi:guanylate kinase